MPEKEKIVWTFLTWKINFQGLLLLIQLTKGNANIQKIVVFENAFEKLLEVISEEGNSDGGTSFEAARMKTESRCRCCCRQCCRHLGRRAPSPSPPPKIPTEYDDLGDKRPCCDTIWAVAAVAFPVASAILIEVSLLSSATPVSYSRHILIHKPHLLQEKFLTFLNFTLRTTIIVTRTWLIFVLYFAGIVVEDCLLLLLNLLKNNASNQTFFKEGSFIQRLPPYFQLDPADESPQGGWSAQKVTNIHLMLQVSLCSLGWGIAVLSWNIEFIIFHFW